VTKIAGADSDVSFVCAVIASSSEECIAIAGVPRAPLMTDLAVRDNDEAPASSIEESAASSRPRIATAFSLRLIPTYAELFFSDIFDAKMAEPSLSSTHLRVSVIKIIAAVIEARFDPKMPRVQFMILHAPICTNELLERLIAVSQPLNVQFDKSAAPLFVSKQSTAKPELNLQQEAESEARSRMRTSLKTQPTAWMKAVSDSSRSTAMFSIERNLAAVVIDLIRALSPVISMSAFSTMPSSKLIAPMLTDFRSKGRRNEAKDGPEIGGAGAPRADSGD
jgi:hypothetical protein